ncbi:MAG: 50S ribosomal protein L13 [Candidatus Bathyarchaeia archaeon]
MKRPKKKEGSQRRVAVIDASGLILGRLASHVAKRVLNGEEVAVVNAERAVITGRKGSIVESFKTRLGIRTLGTQKKAPQHPRRPDTYVRRVVRGMLPWKKPRGKRAYRRLKVYIGVPQELSESEFQTLPDAKKDSHPSMTVGEFLQVFGWENPRNVEK